MLIDNFQFPISNFQFWRSQTGQTLLELVTVVAVVVIVVGALTFATISSLRNANFAKNQAQATKLAQEGIEKVRSLRDRNGPVDYVRADASHTSNFSDLWSINFNCPSNCYFYLTSLGVLTGITSTDFELISPNFRRQFQLEETGGGPNIQKKLTTRVLWTDMLGDHESRLTTILRNPNP